ncbi:ParA family protein [Glutamicibacter sp. NPDC090743]|uniref:ParA family protein n=1 Tax=Glutamicibacter sp. NPDC090743 TaxID=3364001 RepID=UPI0038117DBD
MDSHNANIITPQERLSLRRVIASANGKGGVGKTSVVTNTGTLLADAGYKVLIVDLDSQKNVAINLGFVNTEADDEGQGLFNTVLTGTTLQPAKNIRENLDVVPGGTQLNALGDLLVGESRRGKQQYRGGVARAIASIADQYDIILIDTPPADHSVHFVDEAMIAARWVIAPLRPERKSVSALQALVRRFNDVADLNDEVQLLGVVIFGVTAGSRMSLAEKDTREDLASMLGDIAPVFSATVRNVPAADADAVRRGMSVVELADAATRQTPFWQALRDGKKQERRITGSANSLAEDYVALGSEIVQELQRQEDLYAAEMEV